VIPDRFEYEVAESVEQAVELLGSSDGAKLLAGGHSLLPMMKLRFARPPLLVDVGRLRELSYVREDGDRIAIGALTRHHDLAGDELLQKRCGIVAHTASLIGDRQVRHRGTAGGSIAHGDPASDLPAVLLALEAELVVRGPDGERTVPAADFFRGVFETALGPQDVLTEIRVPALAGGWSYLKYGAARRTGRRSALRPCRRTAARAWR
jgi:carbon-monoxide dehydrogenase medium subunit